MSPAKKKPAEKEPLEADRYRIQLDFSPKTYARLLELRNRSETRTNAELVRNALRLYEWFLDQKEHGAKVQVVDGEQVREVELIL